MLSTFLEKFQGVMYDLSREGFSALASAYGPILTALMAVSVALFGIRAASGRPMNALKAIGFFMKLAGVYVFATLWFQFAVAIQLPLQDGADAIANALLSGMSGGVDSDATALTMLDAFVAAGFEVSGELFSLASWDSVSPIFMSFFVAVATLGLAVTALFVIGVAKMLMGLCAATAPLFLSMLLFETTKPFFQRWLAAFVGAALTVVFAYAMLAAILVTAQSMIEEFTAVAVDDSFGWDDAVGYVIVSSVATLVLVHISSFAASIAGGGDDGSIDVAGDVDHAARTALERYLTLKPIIRVHQGAKISVFVARDLVF